MKKKRKGPGRPPLSVDAKRIPLGVSVRPELKAKLFELSGGRPRVSTLVENIIDEYLDMVGRGIKPAPRPGPSMKSGSRKGEQLTVKVPSDIRTALRKYAQRIRSTMQNLSREAFGLFIEAHHKEDEFRNLNAYKPNPLDNPWDE